MKEEEGGRDSGIRAPLKENPSKNKPYMETIRVFLQKKTKKKKDLQDLGLVMKERRGFLKGLGLQKLGLLLRRK